MNGGRGGGRQCGSRLRKSRRCCSRCRCWHRCRRGRYGRCGSSGMRVDRKPRLRVSTDPEEDELVGVVLELGDGNDEAEVVEEEELKLKLVQLVQR